MNMTPLELSLIGALVGFLSMLAGAVGLFLRISGRFVTRDHCQAHQNVLREELRRIREGQNIQFQMLRGVIVFMDIPTAKKEELLNAVNPRRG